MRVHEVFETPMLNGTDSLPYRGALVKARYAKCCGTCEYWTGEGEGDWRSEDGKKVGGPNVSRCVRNAPNTPCQYGAYHNFPLVMPQWFCGEWALSADAEPLEEEE